jgi:alanine racemase
MAAKPAQAAAEPMRPVVRAEARILMVRQARAGETVSYGAAHTLVRDSRIAVCGVGYADGFHRSASGAGVPLRTAVAQGAFGAFDGERVPVIGKITMDLTMFDVTDLPEGRRQRRRLDGAARSHHHAAGSRHRRRNRQLRAADQRSASAIPARIATDLRA